MSRFKFAENGEEGFQGVLESIFCDKMDPCVEILSELMKARALKGNRHFFIVEKNCCVLWTSMNL